MSECISRDALVARIRYHIEKAKFCGLENHEATQILKEAADALESIPAADVQPVVRGKWMPDYDYTEYDYDGSTPLTEPRKFQDGWHCSLCGWYMPSETNFCPNCGARMTEASE